MDRGIPTYRPMLHGMRSCRRDYRSVFFVGNRANYFAIVLIICDSNIQEETSEVVTKKNDHL